MREQDAAIPGRAEEFLEALAKEVGEDLVHDLTSDLEAQRRAQRSAKTKTIKSALVSDAETVAEITKTLITDERFREGFHQHERESFGNIADEMTRKCSLPSSN